MGFTSRAAQVADAVADVITAAWKDADGGPDAPSGVCREWAKDVVLTGDDPTRLLAGRQVLVFASGLEQPEVLDRGEQVQRYTVGVLVCERYTESAGDVPKAWVDERVGFVEAVVFKPLASPRLKLFGGAVRQEFGLPNAVDVLCDRDMLRQRRTFWAVATFNFRELVT
jgi:hypothetical protein